MFLLKLSLSDGVLSFDSKTLKSFQVHLMISCGCRYGREDLDVLGLTFQKDLLLCVRQIWPEGGQTTKKIKTKSNRGWRCRFKEPVTKGEDPNVENQPELLERIPDNPNSGDIILTSGFDHSYAQRRLMARLGPKAHPFRIKLPPFAPSSITIQPSEEEADKLCGVTYELTAFIGKRISESTMQKIHMAHHFLYNPNLVQARHTESTAQPESSNPSCNRGVCFLEVSCN
ncbi:Beta-arrestin [Fasciola gigantica]|uniref:Beta-arrestin n=1 Tax=Fasciola gigantica TaxID=46835 RepID=A0A504YY97_FASGI|nr:Beta-arrestin [Fasciola gigantica]